MRILLSSRGSRGDVYPVLAIAQRLSELGHRVILCVPPLYSDLAMHIAHQCYFYEENSEDVMSSMSYGWRGARRALHWFTRSLDEQFNLLLSAASQADIMITSVNELTAPTIAEYYSIPHFRLAYAPVIPGSQPPPLQPYQNLPVFANRLMWKVLNGSVEVLFKGSINILRQQIGLDPITKAAEYLAKNSHTLLGINRILAPPSKSWEYPYSYTGYCFYKNTGSLSSDLEQFLNEGPPPVYIGFGSVHVSKLQRFAHILTKAVHRAGCRAIISSGWAGLRPINTCKSIFVAEDTPHAALLPRCSGIIHHGGSGTTHSAAQAGIPQCIMPQIADQFYWGKRVHSFGIGPKPVAPSKISLDTMTDMIQNLTKNRFYRDNARAFARCFTGENGVNSAVSIITRHKNIFNKKIIPFVQNHIRINDSHPV